MHRLKPALWDMKGLSNRITDYFSVSEDSTKICFPKDKLWREKAIKSFLDRGELSGLWDKEDDSLSSGS